MPAFEIKHNANLLNTLPASAPIVNFVDYDEFGEPAEYHEKNAPAKLFVLIDNDIYNQGLSIRTLEFYCQLMYLIISYPKIKLTILTIQSLIVKHTGKKINKNSINKYLKTLQSQGLIYRDSIYWVAPRISNNGPEQDLKTVSKNTFYQPKDCFTPFYITAYNTDTVTCTLALELYFASKYYK